MTRLRSSNRGKAARALTAPALEDTARDTTTAQGQARPETPREDVSDAASAADLAVSVLAAGSPCGKASAIVAAAPEEYVLRVAG